MGSRAGVVFVALLWCAPARADVAIRGGGITLARGGFDDGSGRISGIAVSPSRHWLAVIDSIDSRCVESVLLEGMELVVAQGARTERIYMERLAYAVYLPSRKLLVYRWFNPNIPDTGYYDPANYGDVVVKRLK